MSFAVCVGVAAGVRGGGLTAIASVLKTPALLAAAPAVAVSSAGIRLPLVASRTIGLLADAMIPVMLLTLGVQLVETRALRPSLDVGIATALRLVVSPAVAALLVVPFGIAGLDRAACILQAAMPAAVLVAIISSEYAIAPGFVITTVFYSTLASLPVLTVLLAIL